MNVPRRPSRPVRARVVALLLSSALVFGATGEGRADAQSPGADDAEALIRQGTELRHQNQDVRALPLFERAYALSRNPRTSAQLGLVKMALGYCVDAERLLDEALAVPDHPWIARNLDTLKQTRANARKNIGALVVTGSPSGAEVLLNGRLVGTLPLPGALRLDKGPADLQVRAPEYVTFSRSLKVVGGGHESLSVVLTRASGASASVAAPSVPPSAATRREASTPPASGKPVVAGGGGGAANAGVGRPATPARSVTGNSSPTATGNNFPGSAATSNAATGNAATGNAATSNAATSNAATVNAATSNAAASDTATGNAVAGDTVAGNVVAGEAGGTRGGSDGSSLLRPIAWTAAAGAAAGLVLGVVETVVASHKIDDFNNHTILSPTAADPGHREPDCQTAELSDACRSLRDAHDSARTLAIVGYVAAGALAATSVTLFVLASRQPAAPVARATDRAIACAPMLTTGGLVCRLTF